MRKGSYRSFSEQRTRGQSRGEDAVSEAKSMDQRRKVVWSVDHFAEQILFGGACPFCLFCHQCLLHLFLQINRLRPFRRLTISTTDTSTTRLSIATRISRTDHQDRTASSLTICYANASTARNKRRHRRPSNAMHHVVCAFGR